MDFPLDEDSPDIGDLSKKKIPKELTAHGTTPLGKPRVFVCNTCTRAFARLEHLRRHERSHTKEKPFTCGVCQRKFSRRDLLLRHAQKLHAGCADAITRLRRKLIKGGSIGSQDMYDETMFRELAVSTPGLIPDSTPKRNQGPPPTMLTPSSSQRGSIDSVNFNLNLFSRSKDPKERSRQNSLKDLNLHKQLFDRRKLGRNRGASFSAQSGANYAQAGSDYADVYPGTDTVEFLTPQLLPTTMGEEQSWLSNLLTIPGMSDGFKSSQRVDLVALLSLDNEIPTHTSMFGALGGGLLRSDSVASTNSFTTDAGVPPFPGMSRNGSVNKTNGSTPGKSDVGEYGYSFYDIPDSMMSKGYNGIKMNAPLSPIKQELEDELMDLDNGGFNTTDNNAMIPAAITNGVNFDFNFLNDIDELGQDFDGGSKFLPNGYSFYGDNPSVSSSGIDSTSPPHVLSPSYHTPLNAYGKTPTSQNQKQMLPSHLNEVHSINEKLSQGTSGYSTTKLFTKNMRYMINKSLSKYPISGIMTPSIPSNEKLEFYLTHFVRMFLSHFPFIHPSKLNEQEIMNMTANEEMSNESARVCMPLLVATIGALLTNNKNDSENLYEASRRTIHIYLESRKNSVGEGNSAASSQSVNPLWLIQSLTLSVIYGLFSDNENNVYIVIRQLNALNSLVKTSIKSNRVILFSINEEEENNYKELYSKPSALTGNSEISKEIKFRYNINMQSQVRIVFMIYKLTNFILMMYNVPLTLSINDLGNLSCPNIYDEFLWHFNSYGDFKNYLHSVNNTNDLEFYLARDDTNTIVFKDLLIKLSRSDFVPSLVTRLSNLSKFGFSSAVHGIFEIKQYEEMKYVDVYAILDNLTQFIDNAKNNSNTRYPLASTDYEKLDYALIVCFVKICATIDFKLVKEQSWLRNYDELTNNFHKFMVTMESVDEFEYLKVIDCCIVIIKLVLFRTDDAESDADGKAEIFHPELSFLANNGSPGNFGNLVNDSLQHQYNTCVNFEKLTNWKVFDEIDCSKNSIHSQMLFHVFAILSIFAIYIAKKNNQETQFGRESNSSNLRQFNQRFIIVLRLLAKIEGFLRAKYQSSKVDTDLANLYLFSSFNNDETLLDQSIDMKADDSVMKVLLNNQNYFAYNLEKSLYVLKIGELMLRYLYDTNIKVCIFKKLSGSLSQIRKYLVDEESRVLS